MSNRTNTDNMYAVGTFVFADESPALRLVISHYYQRIYYCSPIDDPTGKDLVYFEHEITPAN